MGIENLGRKREAMNRTELEELATLLAEMPATVRNLVAGLSESMARWKPKPDEFSAVEHVCHLRDIEVEGYAARIGKILREELPALPDLNGSRLAAERQYNEQNLSEALEAFTNARLDNARVIKSLTAEQLSRRGMFENVGQMTLEKLLQMMREHDEAHLKELSDLLAHSDINR